MWLRLRLRLRLLRLVPYSRLWFDALLRLERRLLVLLLFLLVLLRGCSSSLSELEREILMPPLRCLTLLPNRSLSRE